MRAYEIRDTFGVDALALSERPEPKPGPGQVVVKTKAVSLNFRDLLVVKGDYSRKLPLPMTPCSEGGLKPGDTVLTLGSGGVSLFALQFSRLAGARVISTSGSDEKLARLCGLGASDGINYKTTVDWDKRVRELTGAGVDHIVEVGGASTQPKSLKAVRMGGRISLIGNVAGGGEVNPVPLLMKNVRMQGIFVGSREMFEAMNRAIGKHSLRPVVDRVFPFEQAREAMHYLESGAHFG